MDLLMSYCESITYHLKYIGDFCAKGDFTSILLIGSIIINVIALLIIINDILHERQQRLGTQSFWVVFCIFLWGIGAVVFFLMKLLLGKSRIKNNIDFAVFVLLPVILGWGVFGILVFIQDLTYENIISTPIENVTSDIAMAYGFLTGVFVIFIQMLYGIFSHKNRSIYFWDEHSNNEKQILQEYMNRKVYRLQVADSNEDFEIKNYYGIDKENSNNQNIIYRKVSKTELSDCYLTNERYHGILVDKTYRKYDGKIINIIQVIPIIEQCVWANVAAFMLLIIMCTPYIVWYLNFIEKIMI